MTSRRGAHAIMYPVNCDPIDGVCPNVHAMQVRRTSCVRCLQGEPVSTLKLIHVNKLFLVLL